MENELSVNVKTNFMSGKKTSIRQNKVAPISDEAFEQLEKKYNISAETLRNMATELRYSRPKLEAHLTVLAYEAKKRL